MFMTLRKKFDRTDGASAVEYALLIAAISAIIVAIVFMLGGRVKSAFSKTNSCIGAQGSTTACGATSANNNDDGENEGGNKDCKKNEKGCKKD